MKLRMCCPVCDATGKEKKVFMRDFSLSAEIVPFLRYDVCECSQCGMVYAGNMEESMPLLEYYKKISHYENDSFVMSETNRQLYKREVEFVSKYIPKTAKVLDIGCAFGGLLKEMKEQGFCSLTGLEPSKKNCQYAKASFGITAHYGGIGNIPVEVQKQKFDLIILSVVFEHILPIKQVIQECSNLLGENGMIYIIVPDMEQFHQHDDLYQEFSAEHINYFDISSLQTLFSQFGMDLIASHQDFQPIFGIAGCCYTLWRRNATVSDTMRVYKRKHNGLYEYIKHCKILEERIKKRMETFDLSHGIYIWGAGTQTAILFQLGIITQEQVLGVIDSNKNFQGRTAYGHEIQSPEVLREYPEATILISSQYAQEEIAKVITEQMHLSNPMIKVFP